MTFTVRGMTRLMFNNHCLKHFPNKLHFWIVLTVKKNLQFMRSKLNFVCTSWFELSSCGGSKVVLENEGFLLKKQISPWINLDNGLEGQRQGLLIPKVFIWTFKVIWRLKSPFKWGLAKIEREVIFVVLLWLCYIFLQFRFSEKMSQHKSPFRSK